MKYEAIHTHTKDHSVAKMCEVLNVKRTAYYQWEKRSEKRLEKRAREAKTIKIVRKVFDENRQVYGYRRMFVTLVRMGIKITEYTVRKAMRQNGMYPDTEKKYKPTHNGKHDGKYLDNLLKQDFQAAAPKKVWAGDITYIKTILGFIYLAVVLDLYNKEVIGYSISKSIDTALVMQGMKNAIQKSGKKSTEHTVFHSDRGSQYASKAYQQLLEAHNITGSMSRPGCPYDNACSESFFSSAKRECINKKKYVIMDEVRQDIFSYIELFYNRKRLHSGLGYLSPVEYRLLNAA
jgi:Transposase and inactivated derivatives